MFIYNTSNFSRSREDKNVYHIYLLAFYHLVFKDIHQQIFLFNRGLKNGDLPWDFSHNCDLKFRWIVKLKCAIPS